MPIVQFKFNGKPKTALVVCGDKISGRCVKLGESDAYAVYGEHWGAGEDDWCFYAVEKAA